MIPYEIDSSLHTSEPAPAMLDDGFSPPHAHAHARLDDTAAQLRSDAARVAEHEARSPD